MGNDDVEVDDIETGTNSTILLLLLLFPGVLRFLLF